ncbi:MAG: hypothetical protein ACKO37_01665, partial [Vampirovibrionales bacterium]
MTSPQSFYDKTHGTLIQCVYLVIGAVLLHEAVTYWGYGWLGSLGAILWCHGWWQCLNPSHTSHDNPSCAMRHVRDAFWYGMLASWVFQGLNYQWVQGLMPLTWLGVPSWLGWGLTGLLWFVLVGYSSLLWAGLWAMSIRAYRSLTRWCTLRGYRHSWLRHVIAWFLWCVLWGVWQWGQTWHPLTMPWPSPTLAWVDHIPWLLTLLQTGCHAMAGSAELYVWLVTTTWASLSYLGYQGFRVTITKRPFERGISG